MNIKAAEVYGIAKTVFGKKHVYFLGAYEGVSKSFRTVCLERELQWYSSQLVGAVVSLFCESV
jgi:hypothetical protein